MKQRTFIVTGGLRGLGRAMAVGLASQSHDVLAVGHLAQDVEAIRAEAANKSWEEHFKPLVEDLRNPAACDRTVEAALKKFGRIDGLVNNAGLTFTYVSASLGGRVQLPKFWEIEDRVVQDVMNTNYIAASQMASRVAAMLIKQGWGRIINVTTKLETMNRPGATPYGSSKAALEMASEVWAKDVAGTPLTVNILNPGVGAHTDGVASETRQASRDGKLSRFIEPEEMVPPLLWLISPSADSVNGMRFDANAWDTSVPPDEAALKCGRPAGFEIKSSDRAR